MSVSLLSDTTNGDQKKWKCNLGHFGNTLHIYNTMYAPMLSRSQAQVSSDMKSRLYSAMEIDSHYTPDPNILWEFYSTHIKSKLLQKGVGYNFTWNQKIYLSLTLVLVFATMVSY